MDRTERFYRIEQLLQSKPAVPLSAFTDALEVSRATIKRDLEYLRDRFNWPIVWDSSARGYRLEAPTPNLPAPRFSASELQALLVLQQLLSSIQPDLLGRSLHPLRRRITTLLQPDPVNRLRIVEPAARHSEPTHFQTVFQATLQRAQLRITHRNRTTGEVGAREVSPQRLTLYKGTWYLEAWCHRATAIRVFALDAISNSEALAGQVCREIPSSDLDSVLDHGYGIFSGPHLHTAHLRFSSRVAPWVAHEIWHPHQTSSPSDDGRLDVHIPYAQDIELLMDILRYGPDVEVLAPEPLRLRLTEKIREMGEIYRIPVGDSSLEPPGGASSNA